MAQVVFDPEAFRALFPEFADETTYPDATLQMYWDMATCYISDQSNDCLSETCLTLLINLLTAHLAKFNTNTNSGDGNALVESATIDDVSIKAAIPDVDDIFNWWILQTDYGVQYYAILSTQAAGGFYIGGSLDFNAFRGASGNFNA